MKNPCFEKLADFSCVMRICGELAPCGPSALLATKKASWEKDMPFGNPPLSWNKKCRPLKREFSPFIGQKVVFWVKNSKNGLRRRTQVLPFLPFSDPKYHFLTNKITKLFLKKVCIFCSLIRGIAKWHVFFPPMRPFWSPKAHLGHMGPIRHIL